MDALFLQLEGDVVPDIVANVFFIDQHAMDGAAGPGMTRFSHQAASIETVGNPFFRQAILDEPTKDLANQCNFGLCSSGKHYPIGLDALVFAVA